MEYPCWDDCGERGFIPNITLPENFEELVPDFHKNERRKTVEDYAKKVSEATGYEIRLNWSERRGLENISVGTQGGLDLQESGWTSFQEHNLSTGNGFAAGMVALFYIRELLKSE